MLLLQDRLGMMPGPMVAPPAVAILLSLCDGTRDIEALTEGYRTSTGEPVTVNDVQTIINQLDEALVFQSARFVAAQQKLIDDFRAQPCREPFHAGTVYPPARDALEIKLGTFLPGNPPAGDKSIRGIISPHIDYNRGGPVYGKTWEPAVASARAADAVVIFGTDHIGGLGALTLTRQGYRTPFGLLPVERAAVDAVEDALGPAAFAEEIHHRAEHSIELAAVWLHWALGGESRPIVPILCGSFAHFTSGEGDPACDERINAMLRALHASLAGKRVLAVAAADLAHVGPAFGDSPFREEERKRLALQDDASLVAIAEGDAERFFADLRAEGDQRKVCGLPPIYLLLRYLDGSRGEIMAYDQCPADEERTSWVSVTGALLR